MQPRPRGCAGLTTAPLALGGIDFFGLARGFLTGIAALDAASDYARPPGAASSAP